MQITCRSRVIDINVCGFISAAVTNDEISLESGQFKRDDNQGDYFADTETSSPGSFELEAGGSDSDDDDGA